MLTLKSVRRAFVTAAVALPMTVLMAGPAQAAPIGSCGLGKEHRGSSWAYSVRNCHDVTVDRAVVFVEGDLGACRHYQAGEQQNFESQREPESLVEC